MGPVRQRADSGRLPGAGGFGAEAAGDDTIYGGEGDNHFRHGLSLPSGSRY